MSASAWGVVLLQVIFVLVTFRLLVFFSNATSLRFSPSRRTVIVLGSGGHTKEMFSFLSTLEPHQIKLHYTPREYVIAHTDTDSRHKVEQFESSLPESDRKYNVHYIPRSREVGQSYFTSIFSTLYSLFYSFGLVWKLRPQLVLANGPGTCLPICFSAFLQKIIGRCGMCIIVLMESYTCVSHASLTTRLLSPFVDLLFVQWTALTKQYKNSIYSGRISNKPNAPIKLRKKPFETAKSFVLVTVGSTKFESLISAVDSESFVNKLKDLGYNGLHVQYGTGAPPVALEGLRSDKLFDIELFAKKPTLADEIRECDLVIGHAGAGTVFDVLEQEKDLIIVPNTTLMNDHQTEFAKEMDKSGFLSVANIRNLEKIVEEVADKEFLLFPKKESPVWRSFISRKCGLGKQDLKLSDYN